MSSADHSGINAVILRLYTLAQTPENQPVIVRRGVIPNLITFLENEDLEIKLLACQTLKLLSQHPDNKQLLAQDSNLLQQISSVFQGTKESTSTVCESIRLQISDIFHYLSPYMTESQLETAGVDVKLVLNLLKVQLGQKDQKEKKRNLVISVEQLKDSNVEQVRHFIHKLVMSLPGMLSYTFTKDRAKFYLRTPTDKLLNVLQSNGLKCTVISETVCETEYKNAGKPNGSDDVGPEEPSYLKEEESSAYKRSLVLSAESLEDRIARRKKKGKEIAGSPQKTKEEKPQEDKSTASKLFNKVTSFFW